MWSRRVTLGLALAGLAVPAAAAESSWRVPEAVRAHPGAAPWRLRASGPRLGLGLSVATLEGARPLRALVDRRPAVVSLWASWCAPCLVEKPDLDALAARLEGAGVAILSLLAFDAERTAAAAKAVHDRLRLSHLAPLAASAPLERAIGADLLKARSRRPILPRTLLLAPDGRLIGAIGAAGPLWREPATEGFLRALAR